MRRSRLVGPVLAAASFLALASPARADSSIRADLVDAKSIKLDGIPKEWAALTSLSTSVKGSAKKPDLDAKVGLAYDDKSLFVAADVIDDVLRPGADHVEIALGFPGGGVETIEIFPGDPGKSPGSAKAKGSAIQGAKVIEAPSKGGWTLEAQIPWSAFPSASSVRVGLRAGAFVHDADSGSTIKNIVGNATSNAFANLPPLVTECEQALLDGLLKDKSLKNSPKFDLVANVAGDSMKERVAVFDRYLVVLGSNFRKGKEYYYGDLGVDPSMIVSVETRDVTGDGTDEIIVRKRFGSGNKWRESFAVMTFAAADTPTSIFAHEVGINSDQGSVTNVVSFFSDGGKQGIKVTPGTAKGFTAQNYHEATETSIDPLLLPWGTVASQTYKLSGGTFTKASEEKQQGVAAPAPAPARETELPKAPPPPSASELLEKVYDLYKKERNVSGKPRFDLAIDVAGDKTVERVLVHDRDIVVFGKAFKGGTGYSYLTLQQFAQSSDILDLTAKDLTGDGKAEIIVRGVLHANAPKEAGGGTVDREVLLVFSVVGDSLKRVFGAEIARSIGKKRVAEVVTLGTQSAATTIEIASGKATDWTEKTYPFNADTGPVGGLEPLLLPWSSQNARYKWSGTAFAK